MKPLAYLQHAEDEQSTLSELKRIHSVLNASSFFGLYAYATQSGVATFNLAFGQTFFEQTQTKWLFGIDYGRTQPSAIHKLNELPNTEIRIHDGQWVVERTGFVPRQDFHAKTGLFWGPQGRVGLVSGSGNFSSNGLRKSVEAGVSISTSNQQETDQVASQVIQRANELWEAATPVTEILDTYEESWSQSFFRSLESEDTTEEKPDDVEIFWIEAGYVTQNRGADKPGNQIDFPRGMSRYFGFNPPDDLERNSVIGELTFISPLGDDVSNNLRLGNNMMEKVSLPIPETHGFDIYDGKVLVFQRDGQRFHLRALESDDFETSFGDKLSGVQVMASGRRWGHIE